MDIWLLLSIDLEILDFFIFFSIVSRDAVANG